MSDKKQALNIRIPEELHREAKAEAARKGKSLTEVIVTLLTGWLKNDPKPKDDTSQ